MKTSDTSVVEVRVLQGFTMIPVRDIVFIKADGKFSLVYLKDNTTIKARQILRWFEKILPTYCFFRAHYSYLVSCYFIYSYTYNSINLKTNVALPLTRCKLNELRKHLAYFHDCSRKYNFH
jgi:two-component system LytT family response regulator